VSFEFRSPNPLPRELRFKLQVRCLNCLRETFPVVNLAMRRMSAGQVDSAIQRVTENMTFECEGCGGQGAILAGYKPL
jgi:hypothetical protein